MRGFRTLAATTSPSFQRVRLATIRDSFDDNGRPVDRVQNSIVSLTNAPEVLSVKFCATGRARVVGKRVDLLDNRSTNSIRHDVEGRQRLRHVTDGVPPYDLLPH